MKLIWLPYSNFHNLWLSYRQFTKNVALTMAYTIVAPTAVPTYSTPLQKPAPQSTFATRLKAAFEHARRLTEMQGPRSMDAAIAWEAVEALLQSHPYFRTLVTPNVRPMKRFGEPNTFTGTINLGKGHFRCEHRPK